MNGHCITSSIDVNPERAAQYCGKCGSQTITTCPSCNAPIRGYYVEAGVIDLTPYVVPAYCHNCGAPYSWTQQALDVATAVIKESELSPGDQESLIEVLPAVISETPKSQIASVRLQKLLPLAGKFAADALRQLIIEFGCAFIRQQMGL